MQYTTVLLAASAAVANAGAIAAEKRATINIGNNPSISCPDGWTANSQVGGQTFCCPGGSNIEDGVVSCCVFDVNTDVLNSSDEKCRATIPVTASDYTQQVYSALGTSAPASGAATSVAATQTAETATVTIQPVTVDGVTAGGVTIPAMTIPGQTVTGINVGNGMTVDTGAGRTSATNAPTAAGNAGPSSSSTGVAAPAFTGVGAMAAGAAVAAGMIFA